MKYFILIFLIFCAFAMKAQQFDEDKKLDQLVPGYILMAEGDTVKGKVRVQTRSKNQVKVKFISREGKRKTCKPKDILGYGYQTIENNNSNQVQYRWRHFKRREADMAPIPFSSKHVFMEVKAAGKAILYSYYVQANESVSSTYKHCYYLAFEDGSRERMITQDDFSWAVPAFLEDCDKIQTIVDTKMGYANLEEIVEIYNDCDNYGIDPSKCGKCELEAQQKAQEEANKNQHSNKR